MDVNPEVPMRSVLAELAPPAPDQAGPNTARRLGRKVLGAVFGLAMLTSAALTTGCSEASAWMDEQRELHENDFPEANDGLRQGGEFGDGGSDIFGN